MSESQTTPAGGERDRARKKAQNHFVTYDERSTLVKQMIADETAAIARKTEKLRALRLAKEEEDARVAAAAPAPAKKIKTKAKTKTTAITK
jgi:hypothetical protein